MMKLSLCNDGISIIDDFLSIQNCYNINQELDRIFSPGHLSLNGYLGHVFGTTTYKSVALPTASIHSINLLELAIDIEAIIKQQDPINDQRVLTALEIWQEENQPKPLFWHTDNREGMIRAFVYLDGGKDDSGAFRYMKGTHKRKNEILKSANSLVSEETKYYHNKLNAEQVQKESKNIIVANNGPCALVIANTEGFHANLPRLKRRRVLMMEFQPVSKYDYPRSQIYLASSLLSRKVTENIELFRNQANRSPHYYGTDVTISKPPTKQKKLIASTLEIVFYALKRCQSFIEQIRC